MKELAIKAKNVHKTYGNLTAVNNLSFDVPRGICFGFLGPNGAGKTTMMKMLFGKAERDNARGGQVSVFGYDPKESALEIKFFTGIVSQEDNLDQELSVIQNLMIYSKFYALPAKQARIFIKNVLAFMELSDKKDAPIRQLSGGMKRRLLIARALINNPKLLILDEPTTGLDPQVRHMIWDKLRDLKKQGVTILLTTHYMEEAFQICDDLIIMNKGEKVMQGPPAYLIDKHIETYVLELLHTGDKTCDAKDAVRTEFMNNRMLLYADDFEIIKQISDQFKAGDFILRQSNLEDVFLKITGRKLHE
ncbi:MAG: ABC transporter ATP-binding protein [Desulfotignum sp.]|nr:ABC transporter ATP-binding protein [Desulfotignum sp.]